MKFKITAAFVLISLIVSASVFYYSKYFFQPSANRGGQLGAITANELHSELSVHSKALLDYNGRNIDASILVSKKPAKTRIFHFWASWCEPCINEMSEIIEFKKKYETQKKLKPAAKTNISDLEIFMISLDYDISDMQKIIKVFPELVAYDFIRIWDKENIISKKINLDKLPKTFLDISGEELRIYEGEADWKTILEDSLK